MRLFIAMDFDDTVKERLKKHVDFLEEHAEKGNFVPKDNLHATVIFLGEVDASKVDALKEAMRAPSIPPLEVTLTKIGAFNPPRPGKIYWVGVGENPLLQAMHRRLKDEVEKRGFSVDGRPFKPHITLGRKVSLDKERHNELTNRFSPFQTVVGSLSLMVSEFKEGGVQYTPLFVRTL